MRPSAMRLSVASLQVRAEALRQAAYDLELASKGRKASSYSAVEGYLNDAQNALASAGEILERMKRGGP